MQHIRVEVGNTSPDVTIVFHARPYGRFTEPESNLKRTELHRMNKVLFYSEEIFVIETK